MGYTSERNAQILISLLKSHGIRYVIASPGTTNICFIASIMNDPFFTVLSAPEERSAGYMACGISSETGEPVVISCTGATASRNYMPALTEAFYRKLPILAVTSSRRSSRIGHNYDQVTDRTLLPNDVAKLSVQMPLVMDLETEWFCITNANKAILELTHNGNGPVHINLETNYSTDYSVSKIPPVRSILRINKNASTFPNIEKKKVCVFVGAHLKWDEKLTNIVGNFAKKYDAIVLSDHIGNYKGDNHINPSLMGPQTYYDSVLKAFDLLIYIGDVFAPSYSIDVKESWRVNPDGIIRDPFGKLTYVFEMTEYDFFDYYLNNGVSFNCGFVKAAFEERDTLMKELPNVADNLSFSNGWIAWKTSNKLPNDSTLHLGIQNSLRFWNCFSIPDSVVAYANTGGFGIDGPLSTTIGVAIANPNKIAFCVLGDLAFFYDMNSLGNRHLPSNIRILLVNNGKGAEFKLFGNPGYLFGDETDKFIAAAGHYGNKSKKLVKDYSEDLGFLYYSADSKEEFLQRVDDFVNPSLREKPILFEVFTDSQIENETLISLRKILIDKKLVSKEKTKNVIKKIIGIKGYETIKNKFKNKN